MQLRLQNEELTPIIDKDATIVRALADQNNLNLGSTVSTITATKMAEQLNFKTSSTLLPKLDYTTD